jgi:hypothetical protein
MNASQPEAETEYSSQQRGSEGSGGARRGRRRRPGQAPGRPTFIPRGLACAGAAMLAAAEFCPLLDVRAIAAHPRLVHVVHGGPHHGWALLVIAAVAALLSMVAGSTGSRPSAAMIAVLGAGALAITLGVDLPDAHATGLVTTSAGAPVEAQAHAAFGLYLETLGAVVLLLAGIAAAVLGRQD